MNEFGLLILPTIVKSLKSFYIDRIFIKNLERRSSLKITGKNTISKDYKRIPEMNLKKTKKTERRIANEFYHGKVLTYTKSQFNM